MQTFMTIFSCLLLLVLLALPVIGLGLMVWLIIVLATRKKGAPPLSTLARTLPTMVVTQAFTTPNGRTVLYFDEARQWVAFKSQTTALRMGSPNWSRWKWL